jgi:DNA-binding MarR family transcriptional regulator
MIVSFDDLIDMSNEWRAVNIPEDDVEPVAGRRKSPTRAELAIWRTFIETSELMSARIAARLQADSALSPGDYSVLLALSETQGRRMRSSQLADEIGWERSRLSHHLGRMERRALITRERASDDSRGAWVVLTDEGAQTFRRASSPHLHSVQQLFVAALSAEQLVALDEAMRALRSHLEQPSTAEPTVHQGEPATLRPPSDGAPAERQSTL